MLLIIVRIEMSSLNMVISLQFYFSATWVLPFYFEILFLSRLDGKRDTRHINGLYMLFQWYNYFIMYNSTYNIHKECVLSILL
ncbi:hypothetical protein GDO86_015741 [Hymenochirus boettgeri]|uniref:Uncharacterized protein n=1 Tax=Hymenochirus boettgeri TaxID=247094 RepID=A0A8T2K047_9PIPI|nr:hypothetical protein GDO86_015741 [Hymenochirus boettgeri]